MADVNQLGRQLRGIGAAAGQTAAAIRTAQARGLDTTRLQARLARQQAAGNALRAGGVQRGRGGTGSVATGRTLGTSKAVRANAGRVNRMAAGGTVTNLTKAGKRKKKGVAGTKLNALPKAPRYKAGGPTKFTGSATVRRTRKKKVKAPAPATLNQGQRLMGSDYQAIRQQMIGGNG